MNFEKELKRYVELKKIRQTDSTFSNNELQEKEYYSLHNKFLDLYGTVRLRTGIDPGDEYNFDRWIRKEYQQLIEIEDLLNSTKHIQSEPEIDKSIENEKCRNEEKYKNYKLGRITEIIGKTLKWIWLILLVLATIRFLSTFALLPAIFCILLIPISIILLTPIIKLHENTILFTTFSLSKDEYKKKRVFSLIASIIVGVCLLHTIIGVVVMLPHWIFLAKTQQLLKQVDIENIHND